MKDTGDATRVRIRVAGRADIAAMHAVRQAVRENKLVSTVLCAADYEREIEVTGRGWVAELDGELAGFAVGNARIGSLWALFVHPDRERRGIGRRLHDIAVAWLFGRGHARLWLTTEPGTRAFEFYTAAGWKAVAAAAHGDQRMELARGEWHR